MYGYFFNMNYIDLKQKLTFLVSFKVIFLDGSSLSSNDLRQLGRGQYKIKLTKESEQNVIKSRNLVEKLLKEKKG